jgi:hypothetical protein
MDSNVVRIDPASTSDLLAAARPFELEPPAVEGSCGRADTAGWSTQAVTATNDAQSASAYRTAGCRAALSNHIAVLTGCGRRRLTRGARASAILQSQHTVSHSARAKRHHVRR